MVDMERIEEMFRQIDTNVKQTNGKIDAFVAEIKQMKEENMRLKERMREQEDKIEKLEREIRSKNIVIKGIMDEEKESEEKMREKVNIVMGKIGIDIRENEDIDEMRRIGRYKINETRPIKVSLIKKDTKTKILRNAKHLKGTDIWIDEDYPKQIQEERKALLPQLKEARAKGHRAVMKYNRLIIDGEIYRTEDDVCYEGVERERKREEVKDNGQKRTLGERSPESSNIEEQIRKITKTTLRKN